MRRAVVVAVTMVMLSVLAGPALADKPVTFEDFEETNEFTAPAGELCDDFAVHVSDTFSVRETGFFRDGELVRVQAHVRGTVIFTNVESGEQVFDRWSFSAHVDLLRGTDAQNGAIFNVHDRGNGIIVQDTGRIVFDLETGELLEVHGPHEAFFTDPAPVICDALSG